MKKGKFTNTLFGAKPFVNQSHSVLLRNFEQKYSMLKHTGCDSAEQTKKPRSFFKILHESR